MEYLPLRIVPSLFTTLTLPNTTAEPGTPFSYPLEKYIKNATAVRGLNATFQAANGNLSSWLSLDSNTYTLSGTVPNATDLTKKRAVTEDTQVSVILAALDANGVSSTALLDVAIAGVAASAVTTALPTSTGSAAATSTAAARAGGLSNAAKIGLGVGLGLGGALLLALLAFCCLRRRRKARQQSAKPAGRKSTDGDSFVGMVKSPNVEKDAAFAGLPRSHSARLDQGEVPTFSSVYLQRPSEGNEVVLAQEVEEPQRMKAMDGILNLQAKPEDRFGFPGVNDSPVQGEIIRQESLNVPSHGGSDFTHDFTTSESRASWESRGSSFHWSSNEGRMTPDANGRPLSGAASIPRPRPDFAPRYPRHATAGAMARLVRQPSTGTFSEFDGGSPKSPDSLSGSNPNTSLGSRMNTSSGSGLTLSPEGSSRSTVGFSSGKSGLGQFIGSERFSSVDEEEEDPQHAPYDHGEHHGELRLMPSREKFAVSPTQDEFKPQASRTPSEEVIMESPTDAFDDAEEEVKRESAMYNASQLGDLQALGYPADSIVFGSPTTTDRTSFPAGKRVSSIRAVPEQDIAVMSPPMPMGNMLRSSLERNRQTNDGRYIALVNETFNLHPALNPPPSVSLSAATWTAQAPSTYRAERMDGSALPAWLRWDTKEFTLWGIPPTDAVEEVIEVRIMERIPNEKRKNYDSSLYQPSQLNERQVGHVVIQ